MTSKLEGNNKGILTKMKICTLYYIGTNHHMPEITGFPVNSQVGF